MWFSHGAPAPRKVQPIAVPSLAPRTGGGRGQLSLWTPADERLLTCPVPLPQGALTLGEQDCRRQREEGNGLAVPQGAVVCHDSQETFPDQPACQVHGRSAKFISPFIRQ